MPIFTFVDNFKTERLSQTFTKTYFNNGVFVWSQQSAE